MLAARQANMPKDTVERAIKRGAGGEGGEAYEEVRYEGYGPGGVAVIVEALTDNRNRTASEVRAAFTKSGGALGETNSVSFMFDHVGEIAYPAAAASADDMLEAAIEAGADDVESDDDGPRRDLGAGGFQHRARRAGERFGPAESAAARLAAEEPARRSTRRPRRACSSCSKRSKTATTCRTCTPISRSATT